ncbi:MAG: B12-binding domain-containing radical SAM protein [Nitrospirae bacterium]|nr:B12-binding domain-containing radical SAM protein [Nitrospirota bacterium]
MQSSPLKIYALSMDRNLVAIGFRRIIANAKKAGYNVRSVYFLDDANRASLAGSWWKQKTGDNFNVNYVRNDYALIRLAEILAEADVLAFSLMSVQRNIARTICMEVKKLRPTVKIIIGGYHPTIFPEDAIEFSDVICLGEGERTFVEFLERVQYNTQFSGLANTWVRENEQIIKNPRVPIMTPAEMEQMPFMDYDTEGHFIFSFSDGQLIPLTPTTLIRHVGTTYNTIWSVGCPYRCAFCSQSKFIDLDHAYAYYRGPSPDYVIAEIKAAQLRYPLDYVIFYDSNFLGRDLTTLTTFSRKFRDEIGIKFILSGTNPASIQEDKIRVLLEGGLVRIKMGFESGCDDILKLFKRPVTTKQLRRATEVLAHFGDKMVAPSYEMIVDNPFETHKQLYQTLDFLHQTPAPFTISLFSLQFMPGTALSDDATDYSLIEQHMEKEYMFSYKPILLNNLVSVFAIIKPPSCVMRYLKKLIKGREDVSAPWLKSLLYKLMLMRRAFNQARFGDYSTFPYWVMIAYHKARNAVQIIRNTLGLR